MATETEIFENSEVTENISSETCISRCSIYNTNEPQIYRYNFKT